jgi:hypothetical protein
MADDNGKQQKRLSDDGAARRRSSKINEIGVTSYKGGDYVGRMNLYISHFSDGVLFSYSTI